MTSYERYLTGKLEDYELPQAEIDRAQSELPQI